MTKLSPEQARLCRSCQIIVEDPACPLCRSQTVRHPSAAKTQYCMGCGRGPFSASALHLVTWNEDPYRQDVEADVLHCQCEECFSNAQESDGSP